MVIETKDPRISAYILNELKGHELEEFEKELASSEELNELVQNLKLISNQFKNIFPTDSAHELSRERTNRILSEIRSINEVPSRWPVWKLISGFVLFSALSFAFYNGFQPKEREEALVIKKTELFLPEAKEKTEFTKVEDKVFSIEENIHSKISDEKKGKKSIGGFLAPHDFSYGDIASKKGSIFSQITNRLHNRSKNSYHANQENQFINAKNFPSSIFNTEIKRYSNEDYNLSMKPDRLINSFQYNFDYIVEANNLGVYTEVSTSPWNKGNVLVLLSLKNMGNENIKNILPEVVFEKQFVRYYRLIGFKSHLVQKREFDFIKRHNELAAGESITVFYELVIDRDKKVKSNTDNLKYRGKTKSDETQDQLLLTLNHAFSVFHIEREYRDATEEFKFAMALASIGLKLNRDNKTHIKTSEVLEIL